MTRTQKEKGRVGGDLKWNAFKPVKIEIHTHPRAPRAASSRSWQTEGGRVRRNSLSRYTYSGSTSCIPCNKSSCVMKHMVVSIASNAYPISAGHCKEAKG
jgi:hypothetical protein